MIYLEERIYGENYIMTNEELLSLINTHDESEIIEYKENNDNPERIGKYISALGNGALMTHSPCAYMIWGVQDATKKILGTKFNPKLAKASSKNMMPLITYLETFVNPKLSLKWETFNIDNKKLICLIIDVQYVNKPISFKDSSYIRSGSSIKSLKTFPEKERKIWLSFESSKFELEIAKKDIPINKVQELLDLKFYKDNRINPDYDNLEKNLILDNIIVKSGSNYNITNLGAYTLAKNMNDFPTLSKRTIRIIKHNGNKHLDNAIYDREGKFGIANGFHNIIINIMNWVSNNEDYSEDVRKDISKFPQIAVRELVANALVHQDFTIEGEKPTVEIFNNRIEISNPGIPLIEPQRFLDSVPQSRNDDLADLLHKLGIVESRGSGIDRVVDSLESSGLPAMRISVQAAKATIITLNQHKRFENMTPSELDQAIYWHSCLKIVDDIKINNASLRTRFKLSKNDSNKISKAISHAVKTGWIKPYDPEQGRKRISYIPYWSVSIEN